MTKQANQFDQTVVTDSLLRKQFEFLTFAGMNALDDASLGELMDIIKTVR